MISMKKEVYKVLHGGWS